MGELEVVRFLDSVQTRRSPELLARIARVKRFLELYIGDARFRGALVSDVGTGRRSSLVESYAEVVGFDLDALRPLWDPNLAADGAANERWPLVKEWKAWNDDHMQYRTRLRDIGSTAKANPTFDQWRSRQIARLNTELPPANSLVQVYPVIAFELSEGCTIGCRFCAVSAGRFKGSLPYAENRDLWRGLIDATVLHFGSAAATVTCYWATEPFDNPDYLDFIDDVYAATGFLPQTTTAAALRNTELTRRCLEMANRYRCGHPRFSVLTARQLHTIHRTFTPDELLNVDIVNHAKGSLVLKAAAGRLFKPGEPIGQHATIACVIGFLVNVLSRTIRLVAPCLPCEQWPDGYRVLGQGLFRDAQEFDAELRRLLHEHCQPAAVHSRILRFRSDLKYEDLESGFRLVGAGGTVTIENHPFARQLGAILNEGKRSFPEIIAEIGAADPRVLTVGLLIGQFRRQALLDDFGGKQPSL